MPSNSSRSALKKLITGLAIVAFVGCQHHREREPYIPDEPGPFNVYLLYPPDTAQAMIVNYHTVVEAGPGEVRYDTTSRAGRAEDYRYTSRQAEVRRIPGLPDGRAIHGITLTNLEPDTTYYFIAGDETAGFTDERKFRTAPAGDEPVTFITGGDMGVSREAARLLEQAGAYEPLFVLLGGDIAYANGELCEARIWDAWFDQYEAHLKTPSGYTVPMVLGIGNHETNDIESTDPAVMAPYFTGFFGAQSDTTYFSRRFGNNLGIIVLDTGHVTPHADQVDWLREQLQEFDGLPARFAVYHVPFFPAHREFDGDYSALGRQYWMPLFDEFGLPVAFENHDHVYKRSHPIKGGEIDASGTVYLGDGCFGRGPRKVESRLPWYIVDARSIAHFWAVTVDGENASFAAVDEDGEVFDKHTMTLPVNHATTAGVAP